MSIADLWHELAYWKSNQEPLIFRSGSEGGASSIVIEPAHWLMPRELTGYNASDYWVLSKSDQERLDRAVRDYNEIARSISSDRRASGERIARGQAELLIIDDILGRERFPCWEAFALDQLLDRNQEALPPWIVGRQYRADEDSTGAPALWVHFIVDDAGLESESNYPDNMYAVRRNVSDIYTEHFLNGRSSFSTDRYLYVSFGGDDAGLGENPGES